MRNRQGIILAALAAAALGLATSGRTAPESASPTTRQVQVKIEWAATAATPAKSLTVTAAPDQLTTSRVEATSPASETLSATVRSRMSDDHNFIIGLVLIRTRDGKPQSLQTIKLFKPGERTELTGLSPDGGPEKIFVTASEVEQNADPFLSRHREDAQ
ncbi:MAG: hypothetical protein ABIY70_00060 [Capsulimonas sp.]|uniref:hypothetical protein n=1 Tax=Capsulimonas sp. TaxID=2494211 RepID=UPI003265824A